MGTRKYTLRNRCNRQDALVPSSPSFVILPRSAEQWYVASDSSGYSWDAEVEFVISRARRVKTANLDAVFATYKLQEPHTRDQRLRWWETVTASSGR